MPAAHDHTEGEGFPESFLALFGGIRAPADYAERIDEYNRERVERHPGAAE